MLLLAAPNYRREDHLESPLSWVYHASSEDELNTLALDIVSNQVFTSSMVRDERDIPLAFMILSLLDRRTIRYLRWIGAHLLYEYYDKAMPRSVNGYPCFFSMNILDKNDTDRLYEKIRRLQAAMKTALERAK
jgi:hypothetical protein